MIREPATRPGFRLFFDPIGPFKEATLHRYKYALVVLDDFSGLLQAKFMVRLSEWFTHLSGLVKRIEAEKGSERVVAQIGSDSFPAFVNGHTMLEFAASRGILLLASPPYTQKLNPVEGMIKVLVRMALAMLRHAGAPKKLIEFTLNHAILLLNRLPRSNMGKGKVVPLELWLGLTPPSVLHVLKVWGCAAYPGLSIFLKSRLGRPFVMPRVVKRGVHSVSQRWGKTERLAGKRVQLMRMVLWGLFLAQEEYAVRARLL